MAFSTVGGLETSEGMSNRPLSRTFSSGLVRCSLLGNLMWDVGLCLDLSGNLILGCPFLVLRFLIDNNVLYVQW